MSEPKLAVIPGRTPPGYCGFCGKSEHEVYFIVNGPTTGICDECISLSADIITDRRLTQAAKIVANKLSDHPAEGDEDG